MLKKSLRLGKVFLGLISLSLLSTVAFGFDNYSKISYLDSVADSYLYDQSTGENILKINSPEAQPIEARIEVGTEPYPNVTSSNETISISLMGADLTQVLRMLCDKAGIGFLPMDGIIAEKRISLDLQKVKLNDAFAMIMKMEDLIYKIENNTLLVYAKRSQDDKPTSISSISVVPVKYANVNTIAQFLNSNLFGNGVFGLSNHSVVSANPAKNELFVFGTEDDLATVKKVLPLLDTKPLVNTFKVNHVTPKEMAELLCESLFNSKFDDKDKNNTKDDEITIGSGVVACRTDDLNSTTISKNTNTRNEDDAVISFDAPPLTITYFSESGKIGVYGGSLHQAQLVRDFIAEHDKKQLMAYVEISVIELNETGSKTFSNTWNLWTPFISLGFDSEAFNVGSVTNPFWIWGDHVTEGDRNITKTNNSALTYQLQYIIDNGNGRVLSNPKIMVTNGRKATIDMTSDYVKKTTSQILESSDSITSGTQRQYEIGDDEGIVIELVPFISPDGYVTMNLTPEFSTEKQQITSEDERGNTIIEATLLQRRDLELKNVRVRDGESLVLAGLIKEDELQTTKKVPLLGDLPFLGAFFRSSTNKRTREEMVIVVTPHIIKDSADAQKQEMVYDL